MFLMAKMRILAKTSENLKIKSMKKLLLSVAFLLVCSAGSVWAQSAIKHVEPVMHEAVDVAKPSETQATKASAKAGVSEVKEIGASKPAAKSCCANKSAGASSCSKEKESAAKSCDKSAKAAGKSSCCQKGGHVDAKADAPQENSKH